MPLFAAYQIVHSCAHGPTQQAVKPAGHTDNRGWNRHKGVWHLRLVSKTAQCQGTNLHPICLCPSRQTSMPDTLCNIIEHASSTRSRVSDHLIVRKHCSNANQVHNMRYKLLWLQAEHFRVKKQTSMLEFKQLVAQKWQVPVDRQRYWHWATRQNQSVRVSCPVGLESDNVKVCDIRVGSNASLCLITSCFIITDSALKWRLPALCTTSWLSTVMYHSKF